MKTLALWMRARAVVLALGLAVLWVTFGFGPARAQGIGVYVSNDGGETWEYLADSPPVTILALHSDPSLPGWVVAGTESGLWITPDAGVAWVEITIDEGLETPPTVFAIVDDPAVPEALFLATDVGIYRSADAGQSWEPTGDPGQVVVTLLAAQGSEGLVLYAGGVLGVFRSDDRGETWAPDGEGAEGATTALALDRDGRLLIGTTSGLFELRDGADQFNPVPGLPRGIVRGLLTLDDGPVYAGIGPQFFVRQDSSWRRLGMMPLAASGDPPVITSIARSADGRILLGSTRGLHRGEGPDLHPALETMADFEVGPVIVDRTDPSRMFLSISDQPHAAALARGGIEFGPDIEPARDDGAALALIVPILGGAVLAGWYLTRRRA